MTNFPINLIVPALKKTPGSLGRNLEALILSILSLITTHDVYIYIQQHNKAELEIRVSIKDIWHVA